MVVMNGHNLKIDLRKSPMSGPQITETDMRRRRYGEKCKRATRLTALFNDESHSLKLMLWDTRPFFEAKGATMVCHWSNVLQHDKELCDLVIARIARELAVDRKDFPGDTRAHFDNQRELELLLNRVKTMKTEVIEQALYGKKSA